MHNLNIMRTAGVTSNKVKKGWASLSFFHLCKTLYLLGALTGIIGYLYVSPASGQTSRPDKSAFPLPVRSKYSNA